MSFLRRSLLSALMSLVLVLAVLGPAQALPRLLVDMRTGEVLHEEDAGIPWHPASLTKLMTALVAFEAIESGRATLDTPVLTSATALAVPPSRMGYPVDTAIRLEDALYLLIIKSANDIAIAVAETIAGSETAFVALMNQRAGQLGMTGTRFVNSHGLHDPAQITTARDMAVLAIAIRTRFPQYDPMFSTRTVQHETAREHTNNILLTRFTGTDGMKTGYVCASGLNIVATANRDGRRLLAVMMGGNSSRERGEMTAQLLFSGFAGGYRGTGRAVFDIPNRVGMAPVDMRPRICGTDSTAYDSERREQFPAGLEGQVSYLAAEELTFRVHTMATLGRVRDVPLPRPRPLPLGGTPLQSAAMASERHPMGDWSAATPTPPAMVAPVPPPRPLGL